MVSYNFNLRTHNNSSLNFLKFKSLYLARIETMRVLTKLFRRNICSNLVRAYTNSSKLVRANNFLKKMTQ